MESLPEPSPETPRSSSQHVLRLCSIAWTCLHTVLNAETWDRAERAVRAFMADRRKDLHRIDREARLDREE